MEEVRRNRINPNARVAEVEFKPLKRFDLEVGDLITYNSRMDKSVFRVKLISYEVFTAEKVIYDIYTNAWTPLYNIGFSKLDYMQGYLKKVKAQQ